MIKSVLLLCVTASLHSHAFQSPQFGQRPSSIKLSLTTLEDWQLLDNGSVVGSVRGHPRLNDGDVITTSPLANPAEAGVASTVATISGSQYMLGTPKSPPGSQSPTIQPASQFTGQSSFTTPSVATLDDWQLLDDGRVVGSVRGHPQLSDGDVITTSPLANPATAGVATMVATMSGSKYMLGTPKARQGGGGIISQEVVTRAGVLAALNAGLFALGLAAGNGGRISILAPASKTVPQVKSKDPVVGGGVKGTKVDAATSKAATVPPVGLDATKVGFFAQPNYMYISLSDTGSGSQI